MSRPAPLPSPLPYAARLALLVAVVLLAGCSALPQMPALPSLPSWPVFGRSAEPPAPPPPPAASAPAPVAAPKAVAALPPRPKPEPVPRVERIPQGAPNLPYEIRGESYEPLAEDVPVVERGLASWYGHPFHGRRTATGEVYDMHAMTAAHKTMPLPSYAVVRNARNGREVVVRVNDRGPFKPGRVIDLSRAAALKLRLNGLGPVEVRRLTHAEIRSGAWKLPRENLAAAEAPR